MHGGFNEDTATGIVYTGSNYLSLYELRTHSSSHVVIDDDDDDDVRSKEFEISPDLLFSC